jgi:hypothetical protein
VPSSAYFTYNGHTYILEVIDDQAIRVPVRVEYEDGTRAKIAKIVREADGERDEILQDLTGEEWIIYNNQGAIREGQEVDPQHIEW